MNALSELFEETALAAGTAVLDVYHAGAHALAKADGSPVTEADLRAEAVIFERLAKVSPGTPIVGEEAAAAGCAPSVEEGSFYLVDPLDGTKEFIARRDDFTVNIALIENGKPIAGIVYAPALRRAYVAAAASHSAWRSIASVACASDARSARAVVKPRSSRSRAAAIPARKRRSFSPGTMSRSAPRLVHR